MLYWLPSIVVLGLAALVGLLLVFQRPSPSDKAAERIAASRALALATAIQGAHFAEEAATGFHERLGALLGLSGIPFPVFVGFNLLWLGVWVASVPALRSARPPALFAAWFLAVAGMINGVAHPLLAIAGDGYFPGLVSSLAIGGAGVWLCLRLLRATRPRAGAQESIRSKSAR